MRLSTNLNNWFLGKYYFLFNYLNNISQYRMFYFCKMVHGSHSSTPSIEFKMEGNMESNVNGMFLDVLS